MALVRAALARTEADFTTDIVTDGIRELGGARSGPGIAGSATTLLKNASVIQAVGVCKDGTFYAARRASERPGAKTRYVNVYRLASREIAEAFLQRNEPNTGPTSNQL